MSTIAATAAPSTPEEQRALRERLYEMLIPKMPSIPDDKEGQQRWREELQTQADELAATILETANQAHEKRQAEIAAVPPAPGIKDHLPHSQLSAPRLNWTLGVDPAGDLIEVSFDRDEPHVLIAGASGSGKSTIVKVMLTQLLRNNRPEDLNVWIADSRNELGPFGSAAHVARMIDQGVAIEATPCEAMAAMLQEAVDEMQRRYKAMSEHPERPQRLSTARELAISDPDRAAGLAAPYIVIVIEECSAYFVKPLPPDREAHTKVMELVTKLSREARAAGIHLVATTQYPNKENIPATFKHQCQRIGLAVMSQMQSLVVLDEPGLEQITGVGCGLTTAADRGRSGVTPFRTLHAPPDALNPIIEALPASTTEPHELLPEALRRSGRFKRGRRR